tara:strand:+ start:189 stop:311 length:123 start_codon:yes stop_codon:yes gene_type:complete
MIEIFESIIIGALIWVLVNQYRDHACLKKLEGSLKTHLQK